MSVIEQAIIMRDALIGLLQASHHNRGDMVAPAAVLRSNKARWQ